MKSFTSNTHAIMKEKILLVEDTLLVQKIHTAILEKLACTVDLAENGTEALSKTKNHNYDLIFMDVGLPDMSGIEIIEEIRKKEINQRTPIVALTAFSDKDTIARCKIAGVDAIYLKPINQQTFQKILTQYVKKEISI